jgi:hypothetical protein
MAEQLGRRTIDQALLFRAQQDRLKERLFTKAFATGKLPRGFSLSPGAARLRERPEILARAALIRHQAKGTQIAVDDIERATYQLSREQVIAQEITPETPAPGAVIRKGYATDVDAVILAVADCLRRKDLPELENPRVCEGHAAAHSYHRKFTVGINKGRDLLTVTKALATLANCIESRLEVVPHSNTWLGINVRFGLPGKQKWSENEDISRYKRTERRGTHSVDARTRSFDLDDIMEQVIVGPGGEFSIRTSPNWPARPLIQYFDKPARLVEIEIERGHVVKRLEFYLWRSSQPAARPKDLA